MPTANSSQQRASSTQQTSLQEGTRFQIADWRWPMGDARWPMADGRPALQITIPSDRVPHGLIRPWCPDSRSVLQLFLAALPCICLLQSANKGTGDRGRVRASRIQTPQSRLQTSRRPDSRRPDVQTPDVHTSRRRRPESTVQYGYGIPYTVYDSMRMSLISDLLPDLGVWRVEGDREESNRKRG